MRDGTLHEDRQTQLRMLCIMPPPQPFATRISHAAYGAHAPAPNPSYDILGGGAMMYGADRQLKRCT